MGGPPQKFLISYESIQKHGCHGQFLFLIGWNLKILLWKCKYKWFVINYKWWIWGPLQRFIISSWSGKKHGRHVQFIFTIGRNKKQSSSLGSTLWWLLQKPVIYTQFDIYIFFYSIFLRKFLFFSAPSY